MASWRITYEYPCYYWTWKIPNVSSIPRVVGYVVQSPQFSCIGTSWTIKLYPNGDSQQNEGHTSVTIERSDTSHTQDLVFCHFYYNDISNEKTYLDHTILFNSKKSETIPRLKTNLKEISENSKIVVEDTFYLVLQLHVMTASFNECRSATKSATETLGTTDRNKNVVGEIFKEYKECKHIIYKVSDIPGGNSSYYHIESPRFFFQNATWMVKLWHYYRTPNLLNQNLKIVLQRLESEVPVHHVELEIGILKPSIYPCIQEKSISFAPSQTLSPAFIFQIKKSNETKLEFDIELKTLETARLLLEPQNKPVEESSGLNALLEILKQFQNKRNVYDVTLDVNGTEVNAHRMTYAAGSPVLASTFEHETSEKQSVYINVLDFNPESLKLFLDYLFEGKVESISFQNAVHLYKIAVKYGVPDLKKCVVEQIEHKLEVENILDSVILAEEYDDKELYATSQDFFNRNLRDIFQTAQWKTFLKNNSNLANKLLIEMTSSNAVN